MRINLDQRGVADPLLIPLVIAVVFLLGVAGFAAWSYTSYVDAQKVEQAEIDEAVEAAETKLTSELEAAFVEREKKPTRTYTSPQSSGSVKLVYPKTWSVYSQEDAQDGTVETFMHPNYVRDIGSDEPVALKMSVTSKDYPGEVEDYQSKAEKGEVRVKALTIAGTTGVRVDGNIVDDFDGSMVIFQVRDKTLKIWTENNSYIKDFNDIILKNLTFSP